MSDPISRYATLRDLQITTGKIGVWSEEKIQRAFDNADARIIGEFIDSGYAIPLDPKGADKERVKGWVVDLAKSELENENPAKIMRDIERAKIEGLNATPRPTHLR